MLEEIRALKKNETWEIVNFPKGKKPVSFKWIFTNKHKSNGYLKR